METSEILVDKKLIEMFGEKHPFIKHHSINLQDILILIYRRIGLLVQINSELLEKSSSIETVDRETKKQKKEIDGLINSVLTELTRLEYMTAAPDGENFVSRKMIYVAPQERRERAVNYGGLCKKYLRLNPEGLTTNEILQKILEDFPELDPTHAQTRVYNTVFRYNRDKIIESIDGPGYKKYVMVQNKK